MKHHKGAMADFHGDHSEKPHSMAEVADPKYSHSQFSNPEELKKSGDGLAGYVKKHKHQYP